MRTLKTLRLISAFYQSFFISTWIITGCCLWIFGEYGWISFSSLVWLKIFTLGLVFFFMDKYKRHEIYYYQNLGVSKKVLWCSTVAFDFLLFLTSILVTYTIG